MRTIDADNAHEALYLGVRLISSFGIPKDSRNGPTLTADGPVTTIYKNPTHRVLYWAKRDANPFFHLMESLWMLSGRDDVDWVSTFSSNISRYSDDGETFHGAYGKRWRGHFPIFTDRGEFTGNLIDQLPILINRLKNNPTDRRCVLTMWDPEVDLDKPNIDVPCNTHIYFKINFNGDLDMTVCNRSNDIIWGAYGANVVHMSYLQEYIASCVGVGVGRYYQMSNDWHAYKDTLEKVIPIIQEEYEDPYDKVKPYPLMSTSQEVWNSDLEMFMEQHPSPSYKDPFFRRIANPVCAAWHAWKSEGSKEERVLAALDMLEPMPRDNDWLVACSEWLMRRISK